MCFLIKTRPALLIQWLFLLLLFTTPVNAQVDVSSIKRVDSGNAAKYEEAWGVQLFVDKNFNCTETGKTNKFYMVTDDVRFNSSEQHVASSILKALVVFSYERGPTRCIFRTNTPGYKQDFHAIVIFDDEVVLDMPFVKNEGVMLENKAEYDQFIGEIKNLFRPVQTSYNPEEVDRILEFDTTEYYIFSDGFPNFHQSNTLSGQSLVVCGTQELGVNGKLLKSLGATFRRVVKMDSVSELVSGLLSGSCEIIPSSVDVHEQLLQKIAISEAYDSSDLHLIERDKLSLLMKASAAKGSDFDMVRWPRLINIDGNAPEQMASKAMFENAYDRCTKGLTDFGRSSVDCNCVAKMGLDRREYGQCETGYGFNFGMYKFFDYAKSFIAPPRGASPKDALNSTLVLSNCVAKRFEKLVTESITGNDGGGQQTEWASVLLSLRYQCE